jgi:hypothetical protein
MSWIGDFLSGCTVFSSFTTVDTTGLPTALTGNPKPFLVIYKDAGLSCTTFGITLATDCNGITGWNALAINTNNAAYGCGHDFEVVLQGGTVGGTCVSGYRVASFSLKKRSALRAIIHGREVDLNASGAVSINSGIKKNQALANFEFLMTDSTNHAPATGLTVSVTRSIDRGAFGAGTLSAVTEVGVGMYSVDFAAGDLNGNVITLRATAAASDDLDVTIVPDP